MKKSRLTAGKDRHHLFHDHTMFLKKENRDTAAKKTEPIAGESVPSNPEIDRITSILPSDGPSEPVLKAKTEESPSTEKKEGPAPVQAIEPEPMELLSEVEAADRLKIPLEDLVYLRAGLLENGKHFRRDDFSISITPFGMERLTAALNSWKTMIVFGTNLPNPSLILARRPKKTEIHVRLENSSVILARRPGESSDIFVRVRDRSEWCRGMVITDAEPSQSGVWITTARPRFKGKV